MHRIQSVIHYLVTSAINTHSAAKKQQLLTAATPNALHAAYVLMVPVLPSQIILILLRSFRFQHKLNGKGPTQWLLCQASRMQHPDSGEPCVMVVQVDITDAKQVQCFATHFLHNQHSCCMLSVPKIVCALQNNLLQIASTTACCQVPMEGSQPFGTSQHHAPAAPATTVPIPVVVVIRAHTVPLAQE